MGIVVLDQKRHLPSVVGAAALAAALLLPHSLHAETGKLLDQLLGDTNLDFFECSTLLGTAETISETPGYGPNAQKTKDAYARFYASRNKAVTNGESRFAVLKTELSSKDGAETALKNLYIFWRAEIAPCTVQKNSDAVTQKFQLLLERVRVEANW